MNLTRSVALSKVFFVVKKNSAVHNIGVFEKKNYN